MENILEVMSKRHSVRAYAEEPLTDEQVLTIVASGNTAPCSSKTLHFSIIEASHVKDEISEKVRTAMLGHSERFERIASQPGFDPLYGAPVLIVVSGEKSRHTAHDDAVAAVTAMTIAAAGLGLGSCYMGMMRQALVGPENESLAHAAGIPADYEAHAGLVIGFASGPVEIAQRKADTPTWVR